MAKRCPNCGSRNIVYDPETGEYACADCGLVVEEFLINPGPEWRVFFDETREERERKIRVGPPQTPRYPEILPTDMRAEKFIKEFKPPSSQIEQIRRMRKWQRRISGDERWQSKTLLEIERLSEKLKVPSYVVETAAILAHKLSSEKYVGLRRGRRISDIAAALIWYAARMGDYPLTERDITSVIEPGRKKAVARIFRELQQVLGKAPPLNLKKLIWRVVYERELPVEIGEMANEVLDSCGKLPGRSPEGVAATAIYIASFLCGKPQKRAEIAHALGITEVTMRNVEKSMLESLPAELREEYEKLRSDRVRVVRRRGGGKRKKYSDFDFLRALIDEEGSISEVARSVGCPYNVAKYHLEMLEKEGLVESSLRDPHAVIVYRLTETGRKVLKAAEMRS